MYTKTNELNQASTGKTLNSLTKEAVLAIAKKDWQDLSSLIAKAPGILRVDLNNEAKIAKHPNWELNPTILYYIQSYADDSQEFKDVFLQIMLKSNWQQTDECFGNSPLTYAIAMGYSTVIDLLITLSVDIGTISCLRNENSEHGDAKNTPLLLAIKNGDQKTALKLIPYYRSMDLLALTKQGNSALHLACYLKLNNIIIAIINRATELDYLEPVLKQFNSKSFRPISLYTAPFKKAEPCIINGVQITGHETHQHIVQFEEEIGKHNFIYEGASDLTTYHAVKGMLNPGGISVIDPARFDISLKAQINPKLSPIDQKKEYIDLLNAEMVNTQRGILNSPDDRKSFALYLLNTPNHLLKKERGFFRCEDYSNQTLSMHRVIASLLKGESKPLLTNSRVQIEQHELSRHAEQCFSPN
ncbi:MAG: hypothetical protein H0U70_02705 [Tatlockia sp.]|nr:hypothetical protein [Tatlockia sp.]